MENGTEKKAGTGKQQASAPVVDILLSTYNGEKHLRVQLDSILGQSFSGWTLLARDDGSTDSTVSILKEYRANHPDKIFIIDDRPGRLGPCQSFAALLSLSTAPYAMFCDQDDLWFDDKVEIALDAMKEAESQGPGPVLVHTDMKVADSDLKVLAESFWAYQNIDPELKGLNHLLLFNNVTGCTMMVNRALRDSSLPFPPEAVLHDWWVALVASALGRIAHVEGPMALYRQHGKNTTGAVRYSLKYFISRAGNLEMTSGLLKKILAQADAFLRIYGERLSAKELSIAKDIASLTEKGAVERVRSLFRSEVKVPGVLRGLGLYALLVLADGKGRGGPE